MKKARKFLFLSAGLASVVTPLTVAASCGAQNKSVYIAKADRITKVTERSVENVEMNKEKYDVTYIIDTGKLEDKALFQSGYEGLLYLSDQNKDKIKVSTFVPKDVNEFEQAYERAATTSDIVVINGFTHGDYFEKWLNKDSSQAVLSKKQPLFVIGEFAIAEPAKLKYKKVVTANSKFIESGYVIGYATAKYLAEKYPENPEKRVVGTFGGGEFDSVLNFNEGVIRGILDWNLDTANNGGKYVVHTVKPGEKNILSDTGFTPDQNMGAAITNFLSYTGTNQGVTGTASVVLPVAGPATGVLLDILNKQGAASEHIEVIGVDSDQSVAYSQYATRFISSITKEYSQMFYDIIFDYMYKGDNKKLANDEVSNPEIFLGGFQEGWTHFSPATNKAKDAMNAALKVSEERLTKMSADDVALISSTSYMENGKKVNDETQISRVQKLIKEIQRTANPTN